MRDTKQLNKYSVRSVVEWPAKESKKDHIYEERITLWEAYGIDEAIELAEKECEEYCSTMGYKSLKLYQCYKIDTKTYTEVFSLLRDSKLKPEQYLDTFFDTGREHQA